jgi:phosphatidylglycerol:prolipoprotein diacylglycerol transferase
VAAARVLISINPIALQLGPLSVGWFGLCALLGLGTGLVVLLRQAHADGLPQAPLLDAAAWAIPIGVVTARLVFVLGAWDRYFADSGSMWQLPLTGLSLWGGLVGGGLAAASFLGARQLDRRRIADAVAPGLALGVAIGRLGELLEGVGQGATTSLPWGTRYSSLLSGTPDFGAARHPAQLYDGLIALLLGALLLATARTPLPSGVRFWSFLAVYGAARVALGGLRLDPPFLFGLQIDQLIAGSAVVVAVSALLFEAVQRARPRRAAASASP